MTDKFFFDDVMFYKVIYKIITVWLCNKASKMCVAYYSGNNLISPIENNCNMSLY